MGDILYVRTSDLIIPNATLSVTSGTASSGYPVGNLQDKNPAKPFKATGVAVTVRATYGGAVTARIVSLGPHNLVGASVSLTNNAGTPLNQAITIPANTLGPSGGFSVDPFKDFSAQASSLSATQWNLVISGASANVAIGEWHLGVEARILEILLDAEDAIMYGTTVHPTSMGGELMRRRGWARRRFKGRILVDKNNLDNDLATIRAMFDDASGRFGKHLLIPNSAVNDALYVNINMDEQSVTWISPNDEHGYVEVEFVQVQRGPRL